MRQLTPYIVAPFLRLTGYRFSKHFRWGTTFGHKLVYALVDTVGSNIRADR